MKDETFSAKLINHLRVSTIIFLLTSAFLMEGFLCVLMFMPIYYFMVLIGFGFAWLFRDKSSFKSISIPAVVLVLSMEGVSPQLSYPRHNIATYTVQTTLDVATIKANMGSEINMSQKRGWFLRLFPLPDKIQANSLTAGDIHNLHFTYRKWGFGNLHKGEMDILIAKNDPYHIQTRITKNTAYLSHYMNIEGTEVHFTPLDDGGTQISLSVKYERLLDPLWYFGPMQQLAAQQSAKYLVETILIRKPV